MRTHFPKKSRGQSGLTLVEMMVATTILVVMMLGLTAMFNQTQRAFRSGLRQVDVLEGGRAAMDLMTRDIEQITPSKSTNHLSLYSGIQEKTYLKQKALSDPSLDLRTNVLHSVFLLNYSSAWTGIGYRVLDSKDLDKFDNLKVGTLYRFTTTNFSALPPVPYYWFNYFQSLPSFLITNGLTRVIDGVVHFRLNFYDEKGHLITNSPSADSSIVFEQVLPTELNEEWRIGFQSNALPAMVEVELGILEPQTFEQARSVNDPTAFLQKQAGKVHIFRQQIPIRNAQR